MPHKYIPALCEFQSTPPVKAATSPSADNNNVALFQSTPPVKAATYDYRMRNGLSLISIHAAREGGDSSDSSAKVKPSRFQSTPPVKAATRSRRSGNTARLISIHAAREGGDEALRIVNRIVHISIHAAREGGDRGDTHDKHQRQDFNPRRP